MKTNSAMHCASVQRPPFLVLLWLAMLAVFSPAVNGATYEFSSSGNVSIPSFGNATPYPSSVSVSGVVESVIAVRVKINGFSHTNPDDIDAFIVAPGGQVCSLLSDAGGSTDAVDVNLVFDEAAATVIPDSSVFTSGTYRPANYSTIESLPPGGTISVGTNLTALAGGNVNGDWKLFVNDDSSSNSGSITSWAVVIETGAASPEIAAEQPLGTPLTGTPTIPFGNQATTTTSAAKTFTVKNIGTTPLIIGGVSTTGGNSAEFAVNTSTMLAGILPGGQTTFSVTFSPAATGMRTTTLRVLSNDADEAVTDITLTGTGTLPAPEIVIEAPSGSPLSGTATVDFFGQRLNTTSVAKPFTIRNTGTAPLTISSVSLSGGNNAEFVLSTTGMLTTIPTGSQTVISVAFAPVVLGSRSTTLRVMSNDEDEAVFDVTLAGTGNPNGIVLTNPNNATSLVNGAGVTDFGSTQLGQKNTLTFTVSNTATSRLAIGQTWIDGVNGSDFVVTAFPPVALETSATATFQIAFVPSAVGARTGVLHIASTDPVNSPFTVTLTGTGTVAPVGALQVTLQPATAVAAGVRWQVDGGPWQVSGASVATLSVGNHSVVFASASGFSTPASLSVPIIADQTASVTGSYLLPVIHVEQPAGVAVSSTVDFGTLATGDEATKSFTITNSGTANLTAVSVAISGINEGDFDVSSAPFPSVGIGGSTTFTVRFRPGAVGARNAALQVVSNDPVTSPFVVNLTGTGTSSATAGSLQVNLTPTTAIADGARWRVDGGAWRSSGTLVAVAAGSHVISFDKLPSYFNTADKTVSVTAGSTRTVNAVCQPLNAPLDNWSWRFSAPAGASLQSIAFGNGTFVGADGGLLATSTDGVMWTRHRTAVGDSVNNVFFANNLFVALGSNGLLLTSPDGETWTRRDTGTVVSHLQGGIYANGKFVVVGSSGVILTSKNGNSWVPITGSTNQFNNLQGVCYGGGQYIAVGLGSILTSADAVNWIARSVAYGSEGPFLGIEYGGGTYLISGSHGYLTSVDGVLWATAITRPITFTADPSAASSNDTLAFGNGVYVSVGGSGGLRTSPDGITWTSYPSTNPSLYYGFAYGGGMYVAVGDGGIIKSSTDAVTWINRTSGVTASTVLYGAAYGSDRFVVVGGAGAIVTSDDGATWTQRTSTTSVPLRAVVYGGGQFVAVGDNGIVTSVDGITWVNHTQGTFYYHLGIAYGNGIYMTATTGGPPSTSPDGVTWTVRPLPPFGTTKAIAFGNGLFVAVGTGGHISTTPDGITWTSRTSPTTSYLTNITFANNTFAAVCQGGGVVTSPDGVTWTLRPVSGDLWGIGYGDGLFVTGYGGTIFTDFTGGLAIANAPLIGMEQPSGTALNSGSSSVDFGVLPSGATASRTFTIRNNGFTDLALGTLVIDGPNSSDFTIATAPASTITPWSTTTLTINFTPSASGARNAALHVPSNDTSQTPFNVNLSATGTGSTFAATINDVVITPLLVSDLNATGKTADLTLGFAPAIGAELMLVNNTGTQPITGTFSNLAQGQRITLTFGGVGYDFVVDYFGGDTNDLVLHWANVRVMAWGGLNNSGELGDGTFAEHYEARPVSIAGVLGGKTVIAVSAAGSNNGAHSLALCSDGTLARWGGELSFQSSTPVSMTGTGALAGKRVVAISAGSQHDLALCSDGTVASWGYNASGELGDNSTTNSSLPVAVNTTNGVSALANRRVIAIAAGSAFSLALCSDGALVAWGENASGQLGNNGTTDSLVPVLVDSSSVLAGKRIISIAAGESHCLALCSDGMVYAWGDNNGGKLGDNTLTVRKVPVAVTLTGVLARQNVTAVSAGDNHSMALSADGIPLVWGGDGNGQLAVPGLSQSHSLIPVAASTAGDSVLAGKHIRAIAAGGARSHWLASDGTVAMAGFEVIADTSSTGIPVKLNTPTLANGERLISIAGGPDASHNLGIAALLSAPVIVPNIVIEQPSGTPLTGPRTIAFANQVINTTAGKTITVRNTGDMPLTLSGVSLTGGNSSDFSLSTTGMLTTVPALGQTTFTVNFRPTALGARATTLRVLSDDADEATLDIALTGSGTNPAPEIVFAQPVNTLLDGTPTIAFGNGFIGVVNSTKTFQIWNFGTAPLTISSVSTTGSNNGDFIVNTTGMLTTLQPYDQTTFTVSFNATALGSRTTTLRVLSNDEDEGTSDFPLTGTGIIPIPEIVIEQPSGNVLTGTPTVAFGNQFMGFTSPVKTFTIKSIGTGPLEVLGVSLLGGDSGDFIINSIGLPASVPAGGQKTFTVSFNPLALGARTTTMRLLSDDADEGVFDFTLTGTGTNSDPTLSSLALSTAPLTPAFTTANAAYSANVPNWTTSTTITPTSTNAGATIKVNNTTVASGSPSGSINLSVGNNAITTVVTAPDGVTTMTYTVIVTRSGTGPGSVDPGFNLALGGTNPVVYAMAPQPDGKMIIGGLFSSVGGTPCNNVARVNTDGSLDTSFNPNANGLVLCAAVQSDGKVILGGVFSTIGGVTRNCLARVNADGSLDASFNPAPNTSVSSIAVQPDGKIIVAGSFDTIAGGIHHGIARLLATGAIDPTFNPDSISAISHVALQPDGKVLIGSSVSTLATVGSKGIARLNADGTLDTSFADPVLGGPIKAVSSTAIQKDGKVIIGGIFATVGGAAHAGLARLNANGTLDTTFTANLATSAGGGTPSVSSMVLQADGGLVVAGTFDTVSGIACTGVVRLAFFNLNIVDQSFVLGGITGGGWTGLAMRADGKVFIAGPHQVGLATAYMSLLNNGTATQTLTVPSSSKVQWSRSGTAPEAQQVSFDLSTDGGTSWSLLGNATRPYSAWELQHLNLPANGLIRARARTTGGAYNGSSGEIMVTMASGSPTASTGSVVESTPTAVIVDAHVTPNGLTTTAVIELGTNGITFGTSVPVTLTPDDGFIGQRVTAMFTGLLPNTLYFYRVRATNAAGTTTAGYATFTTHPAPTVVTGAATAITNRTATLAGTVNPNGATDSAATFQYGTTTAYGSGTGASLPYGSGTSPLPVTAALTGLLPSTTYHYRLIASSQSGITAGGDLTFTTLATGSATITVQRDGQQTIDLVSGGTAIDFGSKHTGGSTSQFFTVKNTGTDDLTFGTITFSGANAADFSVSSSPVGPVAPGGSVFFSVRFQPTAAGARSATLLLASNDTAHSPFNINLSGTGAGPGGSVKVTITPAAVAAAARWTVANGSSNSSGETESGVAPGSHAVMCRAVPGYTTPARQTVTVIAGQTTSITLAYTVATAQYQWTNFAGQPGGRGNVNGTGSAARFNSPLGLAVDASGNVYVADEWNNRIRKITPAGVVSTFADETTLGYSSPEDLAVDASGNIYLVSYDSTILKITPAGVVTLLAGASYKNGSEDGQGSAARFRNPGGIAVDGSGNVYVADTGNHTIRKITPSGAVTTLAGIAGLAGKSNSSSPLAPAGAPLFDTPSDVAVDSAGNVYVADSSNEMIRKITLAGTVSTLAGSGTYGDDDGIGEEATFAYPSGIAIAPNGSLVVTESSGIRRVTSAGVVTTLVSGALGSLGYNSGVAVDAGGNVYASNDESYVILKITPAGDITTLAGLAANTGLVNATGSAARFNNPSGAVMDAAGNVYVGDSYNHAVRKITPAGLVSTLAGGGYGSTDGNGSSAQFSFLEGIGIDAAGNILVADTGNDTIRKITPSGDVSTLAGSPGQSGSTDANGSAARFNNPEGVTADSGGNVYVADTYNHTVRKIAPNGQVTTLAGTPGISGFSDGPGSTARFFYPGAIIVDGSGNLLVADLNGIRKVTPAGVVTTLVPDSHLGFGISGIAADSSGNLYLTNQYDNTIYRITAQGRITLIGGTTDVGGSADGTGMAALFSSPQGIVVSSTGVLYVVDTYNNRISRGADVGTYPKIKVEFPAGNSLATGTGTVDLGDTAIGSTSAAGTVTILNTGASALTLGAITKDGVNAADFTVNTSGMSTTLLSGESTTFSVTFTPVGVGARAATLQIASNDADGNPFDLILSGTGIGSSNADLANLVPSSGSLSPAFSSGVVSYSMTVPNTTASITVTPTKSDANASIKVNDVSVVSGTASASISLNVGLTSITTVVTAQDGTTKTYTIDVTRAASSNANLANLVPSTGALTPAFSPATINYSVVVPINTATITITPTKADSNASIKVNGVTVASGTASGPISLNLGNTSITTEVTAQDGTVKSYLLNVIRPVATVITGSATAIISTGATLNGSINPNGAATTAAFEWGTSPTLATFSTLAAGTTNAGTAVVAVNAVLTGLTTGTTYYFRIKGTRADSATPQRGAILSFVPVASPDIAVEQPTGISLISGVSGIDYGPVIAGRGGIAKTFTIKNAGTGSLTGLGITKDGTAAGDFKVEITGMKTTLTPGGSTAFTVTFSTAVLGARTAILHIASNDPDEAPFDITLTGTGAPGIVFESALTMIEEEAGTVDVSIIRTGSYSGAVSVRVNSTPDTATAADFGSVNNVLVSFADGESRGKVTVNITPDTLTEVNEVFKLTLSDPDPSGDAIVGSGSTTTVRIIDLIDTVKPTVTIITPAANANVAEGTPVTVTGSASDNKGVRKVQVSLNGGLFVDAVTTLAANGLTAAYTAPLAVAPGVNTVAMQSIDTRNNVSSVVTRSITYRVPRTLLVTLNGPSSGTVTAGFEPSSIRDVNMPYTITATPKTGFVFDGWVVNDFTGTGITTEEAELPALTFTMQENLHLTASFITNPFAAAAGLIGAFNGPVSPSPDEPAGGTEPDVSTVGQFSAAITTTGSFTGTLKIDGASLPVSTGKFDNDGVARFGTSRAKTLTLKRKSKPDLEVALKLDMNGISDTITGTVTQKIGSVVEAVSDVEAERAVFSSKSPAPSALATVAGQRYNLIFPARATQAGLTTAQFPQGTGIGSMVVKSDGTVTFAGTLADNTGFTSSTTLSEEKQCPLFVQLYSLKGSIAGLVTLDTTQTGSDALGLNCLWIRPPQPTLQWYPSGWPDSIQLDLIASKFSIPTGLPAASVIPGLGTLSPNATLSFVGGLLTGQIDKNIHISPTNVVTEIPADSSFTIALTKTTGEITGTFTHSDTKKPTYKATTIQKAGQYQGTWGFFMTMPTTPVNHLGQSGVIRLLPK